eukprot:6182405-Pleurochrysis_carterae.AAC.1
MNLLYTSGDGRDGQRTSQLKVRARLVAAVADTILKAGGDWMSLPLSNADVLSSLFTLAEEPTSESSRRH